MILAILLVVYFAGVTLSACYMEDHAENRTFIQDAVLFFGWPVGLPLRWRQLNRKTPETEIQSQTPAHSLVRYGHCRECTQHDNPEVRIRVAQEAADMLDYEVCGVRYDRTGHPNIWWHDPDRFADEINNVTDGKISERAPAEAPLMVNNLVPAKKPGISHDGICHECKILVFGECYDVCWQCYQNMDKYNPHELLQKLRNL